METLPLIGGGRPRLSGYSITCEGILQDPTARRHFDESAQDRVARQDEKGRRGQGK